LGIFTKIFLPNTNRVQGICKQETLDVVTTTFT